MACLDDTRVPVTYLEGNCTVEQFAEEFVLSVEQVQSVLESSKVALLPNAGTRSV